jgi:hypothetical protein
MYKILILLLLAGCGAIKQPVNDPTSKLLLPIVQAQNDLQKKDYPALEKDLVNAKAAAIYVANQDVKYQQDDNQKTKYISDHYNDLLGAKAHRIERTVLFIGVPLFFILGGFLIYSGNVTVFAVVAHFFLGILTLGIHWVHLAIVRLVQFFRKPAQKGV